MRLKFCKAPNFLFSSNTYKICKDQGVTLYNVYEIMYFVHGMDLKSHQKLKLYTNQKMLRTLQLAKRFVDTLLENSCCDT